MLYKLPHVNSCLPHSPTHRRTVEPQDTHTDTMSTEGSSYTRPTPYPVSTSDLGRDSTLHSFWVFTYLYF